jgi:hypothetical protein
MPLHHADTPERHVRRALQLLEELEDDLRVPASSIPAQYDQVELLTAARRRLWLAAAALNSSPDTPRSWVRRGRLARKCASRGMAVLAPAGWVASAVAFVLRFVWRSMRVVVRLVYTLRAIWP